MPQSYSYSRDYDPPAPTVWVTVRAEEQIRLNMLLDTGADATMLPLDLLQDIGAAYVMTQQMRGVTGEAERVDLYVVEITINTLVVPGIHAAGMKHSSESILGRDVLNQLIVTLDGIGGVTEIS